MKSIAGMTVAELGAFVQEHLRGNGIDMVLGGGACVSIYSHNKYSSMDLDMIHTSLIAPKRSLIRDAMSQIGFVEEGRYFRHVDTIFFIEFPAGPPAVGEEPVMEIIEQHQATGVLKIISPTDCVKDRLTWFYHNDDRQALNQAILVAQDNEVNLEEIKRWSKAEGKFEKFRQIRKALENKI